MVKDVFAQREELLTRNFDRKTNKRIVICVVWSVAFYGVDRVVTWTLLN